MLSGLLCLTCEFMLPSMLSNSQLFEERALRIGLLLYPDVEPIDLATVGVISMARRVIPELSYITLSEHHGPVTLANGLRVLPDYDLASAPSIELLVVPGGPGWQKASQSERVLTFLRGLAPNVAIGSVCTGAMILASAGLLDGLLVTTKCEVVPPEESPLERLERDFPRVRTTKALLVDNGRIFTGGGVSLCIDAMLDVLQKRYGQEKVAEVARIMEYGRANQANLDRLAVLRPGREGG